jgi:hypothetical protein
MEYKGYNIKQLGTFPMVEIRMIGQGPSPDALKGLYTTKTAAMKAIDSLLFLKEKGVANAKTKGTSQS